MSPDVPITPGLSPVDSSEGLVGIAHAMHARMIFRDRREAGRQLARLLQEFAREQPIVLALTRGGVSVGYEVAKALEAPFDIWVVGRIAVPREPELTMGAVAEGGYARILRGVVAFAGISDDELAKEAERKRREIEDSARRLRGGRPRPHLGGRTVILVDDGIATGETARAVVRAVRAEGPKKVILAVPVAGSDAIRALRSEVDAFKTLCSPAELRTVARWYEAFDEVTDEEVKRLFDLRRKNSGTCEEPQRAHPAA